MNLNFLRALYLVLLRNFSVKLFWSSCSQLCVVSLCLSCDVFLLLSSYSHQFAGWRAAASPRWRRSERLERFSVPSLCSFCRHNLDVRIDVEAARVAADLLDVVILLRLADFSTWLVCRRSHCADLAQLSISQAWLMKWSARADSRRHPGCRGRHLRSLCRGQPAAPRSAACAVSAAAADVEDFRGVLGRFSRLRSAADCFWRRRPWCCSSASWRCNHWPSSAASAALRHLVRDLRKRVAGPRTHPNLPS